MYTFTFFYGGTLIGIIVVLGLLIAANMRTIVQNKRLREQMMHEIYQIRVHEIYQIRESLERQRDIALAALRKAEALQKWAIESAQESSND